MFWKLVVVGLAPFASVHSEDASGTSALQPQNLVNVDQIIITSVTDDFPTKGAAQSSTQARHVFEHSPPVLLRTVVLPIWSIFGFHESPGRGFTVQLAEPFEPRTAARDSKA